MNTLRTVLGASAVTLATTFAANAEEMFKSYQVTPECAEIKIKEIFWKGTETSSTDRYAQGTFFYRIQGGPDDGSMMSLFATVGIKEDGYVEDVIVGLEGSKNPMINGVSIIPYAPGIAPYTSFPISETSRSYLENYSKLLDEELREGCSMLLSSVPSPLKLV